MSELVKNIPKSSDFFSKIKKGFFVPLESVNNRFYYDFVSELISNEHNRIGIQISKRMLKEAYNATLKLHNNVDYDPNADEDVFDKSIDEELAKDTSNFARVLRYLINHNWLSKEVSNSANQVYVLNNYLYRFLPNLRASFTTESNYRNYYLSLNEYIERFYKEENNTMLYEVCISKIIEVTDTLNRDLRQYELQLHGLKNLIVEATSVQELSDIFYSTNAERINKIINKNKDFKGEGLAGKYISKTTEFIDKLLRKEKACYENGQITNYNSKYDYMVYNFKESFDSTNERTITQRDAEMYIDSELNRIRKFFKRDFYEIIDKINNEFAEYWHLYHTKIKQYERLQKDTLLLELEEFLDLIKQEVRTYNKETENFTITENWNKKLSNISSLNGEIFENVFKLDIKYMDFYELARKNWDTPVQQVVKKPMRKVKFNEKIIQETEERRKESEEFSELNILNYLYSLGVDENGYFKIPYNDTLQWKDATKIIRALSYSTSSPKFKQEQIKALKSDEFFENENLKMQKIAIIKQQEEK